MRQFLTCYINFFHKRTKNQCQNLSLIPSDFYSITEFFRMEGTKADGFRTDFGHFRREKRYIQGIKGAFRLSVKEDNKTIDGMLASKPIMFPKCTYSKSKTRCSFPKLNT